MDHKFEVDYLLIDHYFNFINQYNEILNKIYKCDEQYDKILHLISVLISLICNLDNNFRFLNDKQHIELTKIITKYRSYKDIKCDCLKCMLNNKNSECDCVIL